MPHYKKGPIIDILSYRPINHSSTIPSIMQTTVKKHTGYPLALKHLILRQQLDVLGLITPENYREVASVTLFLTFLRWLST